MCAAVAPPVLLPGTDHRAGEEGSTATEGSTSAPGYNAEVGVPPTVQPANGLACETGPLDACAGVPAMRMSVTAAPAVMIASEIVITIVGCGGTGSQIVTGMPYLHQALLASGHPQGLQVFLVDGDRITETNCVRQPFSRSEIGLYKAVVLINRLNMFWGLDWEAVPHFVRCGQDVPDSDFLISCVDNRSL